MYGFNRLRVAERRVTARDVPPVVPWLSRQVGCREAPSNHPCDKRLRGQGVVAVKDVDRSDRYRGGARGPS